MTSRAGVMTQISTFSGGSSGTYATPPRSSSAITEFTSATPKPALTMPQAMMLSGVEKLSFGTIPRERKHRVLSVCSPVCISIYGSRSNIVAGTLFACASGSTGRVARTIAEVTGGELFEIKPETEYKPADLNWNDPKSRSSVEMNDEKSRPAIAGKVEDMAQYDTVFIGFPIWWYVAPALINSFLESYDFSGKTIILFATSGGSGFGKTVEGLKNSVSPTARIIKGRLLNGRLSESELRAWVQAL